MWKLQVAITSDGIAAILAITSDGLATILAITSDSYYPGTCLERFRKTKTLFGSMSYKGGLKSSRPNNKKTNV
jgi:hypothetical protein